MFRIYKKNLIYISRNIGEDFKVKIKVFYRYGLFKVNTIYLEEELSSEMTLKMLIETVEDTIDEYDKILKL